MHSFISSKRFMLVRVKVNREAIKETVGAPCKHAFTHTFTPRVILAYLNPPTGMFCLEVGEKIPDPENLVNKNRHEHQTGSNLGLGNIM